MARFVSTTLVACALVVGVLNLARDQTTSPVKILRQAQRVLTLVGLPSLLSSDGPQQFVDDYDRKRKSGDASRLL